MPFDWKFKHFEQHAIFSAPLTSVLEAARHVAGESFEKIEPTQDGFIASGRRGWHATTATFRASSAAEGTRLDVELLAQRAAMRGYMLFDVGGYYNAQIDKWFTEIAGRLAPQAQDPLVRKSTMSYRIQQGCLAGCAVWFVLVLCLGTAAAALDRSLLPGATDSASGPFSMAASLIALGAGLAAFIAVAFFDGGISRFLRERQPMVGGIRSRRE